MARGSFAAGDTCVKDTPTPAWSACRRRWSPRQAQRWRRSGMINVRERRPYLAVVVSADRGPDLGGGVGEPGVAVDLFLFWLGFQEDQADALGVGGPCKVGADGGGNAATAERGQDTDGSELADGRAVARDVDKASAGHRVGGVVDCDGDEAAALGQAVQPGDVVRSGRAGHLVGVVLDGGGGGQIFVAGGLADGDSGG